MSKTLKGISASNGVGMAKALIVTETPLVIPKNKILNTEADKEVQRVKEAIALSHKQLESLYSSAKDRLGEDAEIMLAQIEMLNDPTIEEEVEDKITTDLMNAEFAIETVLDEQIEILAAVEDEYIRERAADLADIKTRLLHALLGKPLELIIDSEAVLICDILTPSQTANLRPEYVKGIVCETGGVTAHAAIIARSLGIPAIMGCKNSTEAFKEGEIIFVDGSKGYARTVENEAEAESLKENIKKNAALKAELLVLKDKPTGKPVSLTENIGAVEEYQGMGDGVGLFRTEFLYMEGKNPPGEDAQFAIYKKTVERVYGENGKKEDKKLIFRTFDIGGDKEVPYLQIPKEDNPFLGWRAVRICLDKPEMFKIQLRALLRASHYGSLQIMIPMISSLEELRAVRKVFNEVKEELRQNGIPFDENTKLGIMIEIPSAAVCADSLAKEADFFSIGTNDLIQYTLAVDRGNEKVSKLYDFYNPGVLRLVKMTIDASHKAGITTSMCGEAAGDPIATLLLLGLGLDGFSMSGSVLLKVKKIITEAGMDFAKDVAEFAMEMETGEEIREFLVGKLRDMGLEYLVEL